MSSCLFSSSYGDHRDLPSFPTRRSSDLEVDLRTVHLVRDSRGVAWSWQRRVEKKVTEGAPALLPRFGPVAASARWLAYNAQASSLGRGIPSMRLRYEDLVREPRASIARILRLAGIEPTGEALAFVGERE